jgi:hypothetical protein
VELFTSQSCSSCPPADKVLGELSSIPNVIALGCHVTYWDQLNWKDTLSLPACTQRQRTYAGQMDLRQVYTPQMVVNGRAEFVGSNRSQALSAVKNAANAPNALKTITLTRAGDALTAQLPQLATDQPRQTLWLMPIGEKHTQAIRSGENGGLTVTYNNPVAALSDAGAWDGKAETRTFRLEQSATVQSAAVQNAALQGYALIAQNPTTGAISAAGMLAHP